MTAAFSLRNPSAQRKLALASPARPPQCLTERYRPATLSAIVGQGPVVWRLTEWLETPYSVAMMFHGPTGVGKTSAAKALAYDLGCSDRIGCGLEEIKSGTANVEEVQRCFDDLHYAPLCGTWRVIIIEEADTMSGRAKEICLSALEGLPDRRLVILTTNHPEKFAGRSLHRCERFEFEAGAVSHGQDAQALIDHIWRSETGTNVGAPRFASLRGVVESDGSLSYRETVQQLVAPLARWRMESAANAALTVAYQGGESIPFIARRFKLDEATVRGRMASLGLA